MRKALIVGVDYYEHVSGLFGCVHDAISMRGVLARHADRDSTPNFGVRLVAAKDKGSRLTRSDLKLHVQELFKGELEIALFYFAGHGHVESSGGFILASDARSGDEGLALAEVMAEARRSASRNKIIILDSCHAGVAGASHLAGNVSEISDGMTILAASTADEYASEQNGGGVFTRLMVNALEGGAADLVGAVTPGSVYAHVDQSLGQWEQRPVFKTNVKQFVSLRKVAPPISIDELRMVSSVFVGKTELPLDPSYEPSSPNHDPVKTKVFAVLQSLARVNLVAPVGAAHMYYAAMESRSCRLTVLGQHYRRLVDKGLI